MHCATAAYYSQLTGLDIKTDLIILEPLDIDGVVQGRVDVNEAVEHDVTSWKSFQTNLGNVWTWVRLGGWTNYKFRAHFTMRISMELSRIPPAKEKDLQLKPKNRSDKT